MASRLDKTNTDYLVIAVCPALIMTLIGSLVFFLLEIFYHGSFQTRLHYLFSLFIFAAVLIGRISIEEGRERAALFALPLALASGIVINHFVDVNLIVNLGLLALVWWCADKLTWDCTLIDETQDSSGEGLLQNVFGKKTGDKDQATDAKKKEEPQAATEKEKSYFSFLYRLQANRRKAHAPGRWIIYFSLAALPLFGLGQKFISPESRRYAFGLLSIYAASGLGLLLTTSFLGLRRYLRQRKLEMPAAMTGAWLTTGILLVVILLMLSSILPRPSAEYAIAQLPFKIYSPGNLESSRHATGREGVQKKQSAPNARPSRSVRNSESEPPSEQSKQSSSRNESQEQNQQASERNSQNNSQSRLSKNTQSQTTRNDSTANQSNKSGDSKTGNNEPSKQESNAPGSENESNKGSSDPGEEKRGNQPDEINNNSRRRNNSNHPQRTDTQETKSKNPQREQDASRRSPSRQTAEGRRQQVRNPSGRLLQTTGSWISILLKCLFYLAIAVLIIYLIWKHWQSLLTAFKEMLRELLDFWNNLWAGRRKDQEAEILDDLRAAIPEIRPFSDFTNPFTSGMNTRCSPEELIRYSFEAFEAWGSEHGSPKSIDQTPHEFARQVSANDKSLADEAQILASLYNQAAFAPGSVSPSATGSLKTLWNKLQNSPS